MPTQVIYVSKVHPASVYKDSSQTGSSGDITDGQFSKRIRTWSRTSNYKQVRSGTLPTLPYLDDQHSKVVTPFTVSFPTLPGCTQTNNRVAENLPSPNLADSTPSLNRAISKAATKVGDYTVNLGVAGVEAKKTAKMFNNAVQTIIKAGRNVRRGRFLDAAKQLGLSSVPKGVRRGRSFQNNWLEYRYGWRTLMMDVDGAVRHLAQVVVERPPLVVVKAQDKETIRWSESYWQVLSSSRPYPGWSLETYNTLYVVRNMGASITYKFVVNNPSLSNANQLGLVNPLAVAWEVIPFSFVVDWFVNVGDCITNMTSFVGKTLVDGTQTWFCEMEITTVPKQVRISGTSHITSTSSPGNTVKRRVFERKSIGWLSPTPRFSVNLTGNRLVDAGALLRQRFSR